MAYFNHSFCKSWLAVGAAPVATTPTAAFTAGEMALVDGTTYLVDTPAAISALGHHALLVGGNFHPSDSIGNNPGHGGYQESIKSKGINFRYISRLGVAEPVAPAQATATICVASNCAPCDSNLFLRLDVKGSPALRFLNHNAYAIGDSSGDAAANGGPLPGLCCVTGQEFLDPAMALAAAMQMVLADPIVKPFIAEGNLTAAATVTGSATTGSLFNGTYTAVATSGSGSGTGATVTIIVAGGVISSVTVYTGGSDYALAEVLTVDGSDVGGVTVTDDITMNIATLSGAGISVTVAGLTTSYSISEILNGTYTPSILSLIHI